VNAIKRDITANDINIPCYTWPSEKPRATVIFVHGLKSHAGWFMDAGHAFAERGIKIYAFDRRGSGLSQEARGDITHYRAWLDDIDAMVRLARSEYPNTPVHILGHCFGAKQALGYALLHQNSISSLSLIAPPQGALKVDISLFEKLKVGFHIISGKSFRVKVPIEDTIFTDEPNYVEFIKNDALRLQTMTTRFCVQVLKFDRWIAQHLSELKLPILCLMSEHDDIVDLNRFRNHFFNRLTTPKKEISLYDCRHHLLYEPHRLDVLNRIENWICPPV
jgi:alpha-beta hydrolase superfamily lysophospholipase